MKGLTDKQKNMIEFIEDFMSTVGMAPTIYEIAEHFEIKTSTVFAHIRALQKKSVLTRSSKARSIALTHAKKKKIPAGAQSIPVVDAAGQSDKELICDSKVFHRLAKDRDLFAMHVQGSDMAPLGILDGDIVIVKSNPASVNDGDIVLTEVNGQNVLRSCRPGENDEVEISCGHPEEKIIRGKRADIPLKGVVIGLQRSI